jgi:DNA-binding NarL/FixJ family response regulator
MEYIPMVFRNIYFDQPIFKIENNVKILESEKSDDGSYTTLLKIKSSKQVWKLVINKSFIKEYKNGKPSKIGVISIPIQLTASYKSLTKASLKTTSNKESSVLTRKELIILKDIVDGMTNKEIAEKYFISIYTVQTHRKRILKKLAVKNTADLIRFALMNNLTK